MDPNQTSLFLKYKGSLPRPRPIVHTRSHTASDYAMLILHPAAVQGNLVLWTEDSDSGNVLSDRQAAEEHPHCARAQLLARRLA